MNLPHPPYITIRWQKAVILKKVMAAQKMSGPLALGFILYGMVWYGMEDVD